MPEGTEAVGPPLGHGPLTALFAAGLDAGRLASAYLLAGPPGVGKRHFARWAVRLTQCAARKGTEPCGTCNPCRASLSGNDPCFVEVAFREEKGEHESMVEAARRFAAEALRAAAPGRRCFYLLPNIQDYSLALQNSLLKTLEEPPAGVTFFLTADRPEQVLETIVSRCQEFQFLPLAHADLIRVLEARGFPSRQAGELALLSAGRVDLALKFATEPYRRLLAWFRELDAQPAPDFLVAADEATVLAEDLEGEEGAAGQDRPKLAELAALHLRHFFASSLELAREHYLAFHILNLASEELLGAREALAGSGHPMLCLEQYFRVAFERRAQILRFSHTALNV